MASPFISSIPILLLALACSDSNFEGSGTATGASRRANTQLPSGQDAPRASAAVPLPDAAVPLPDAAAVPSLSALAADLKVAKGQDVQLALTVNAEALSEPLSFEILEAPTKGEIKAFDATRGKLTFRVAKDRFGSDRLRFKVKAGALESEALVNLELINRPPVVTAVNLSAAKNSPATIKIVSVDPDGDTNVLALSKASDQADFYEFDAKAGTLIVHPKPNYTGALIFELQASDGEITSEAALIQYTLTDTAPEAKEVIVATIKDMPVNLRLEGVDADVGDKVTFAIKEAPANGRLENLDPETGDLVFVPAANFVGETAFVYTVSDGDKLGEGVVRISVRNNLPLVSSLAASVTKNAASPIDVDLKATAVDPDGHGLTFAIAENPKHGVITLNAVTGLLTYVPAANYAGVDTLLYTANDGAATSLPGLLTIIVTNTLPTFVSSPVTSFRYYLAAPDSIVLEATMRDFRPYPSYHPDFENPDHWGSVSVTPGIVARNLDANGKPVLADLIGQFVTSPATFAQWYTDVPGVNSTVKVPFVLTKVGNLYSGGNSSFFPLDGKGFGDISCAPHNCHFTTEFESSFRYMGDEVFTFDGDDDFWLFINNKLAVDIGGKHPPIRQSIDLKEKAAELGLVVGHEYPFKIFQAERSAPGSTFKIETSLALKSDAVYTYQAQASDSDTDDLVYRLLEGPVGMTINATTGVITWTPKAEQLGVNPVSLEVRDGSGGRVVQTYDLIVE